METTEDLRERLRILHTLTAQTPLFNPVFQLSLDLSRELEAGTITLADLTHWISTLECESLQVRALHLKALLAPISMRENDQRFQALVNAPAPGFDAFAAQWEQPLLHIVFTGHPTFLLNKAQSDALAAAVEHDEDGATLCLADTERTPMTLDYEHDRAMTAITHASAARTRLVRALYEQAAAHWPDKWHNFAPIPYRFATWVGYDMDGRTDISWATSLRYRLLEKAQRLESYADDLGGVAPDITAQLRAAAAYSSTMAAHFAQDLSSPVDLSAVANVLTADDANKLTSLSEIITTLDARARKADFPEALTLRTTAALMRADGLGMGQIHFRVNSAQLLNAIRRLIDPENVLDLASRGALIRLRALLKTAAPLKTNFGSLAIENATAVRQFLAMAQILRHIDSDTPIRMLIAECEQPQTVLAALYFARLFGIEEHIDISPLFETESAMEHGGRFLDALLGEEAYRTYARKRGRVAIQTGFSDAGRFVGQIPAALAIERLHASLARMMARHGLTDVAAIIFNTHGESMGRGAHPVSMAERLTYPMSHWARAQFAKRGIRTECEASFQGGDGFLFFQTPALAQATLTRIAEVQIQKLGEAEDDFYTRTDLSLDFYRGIRRVQRQHLESRTYARAITAFGLGLLNETGSRKSRRQSDLAADRDMNLRQIRAIPHNAILQQLGYPVNVIAGMGSAASEDVEDIAELLNHSTRGRQIVALLLASDRLASIKTVAAYGELFNSAFWATRPYRGTEDHLEAPCLELAERLTNDDRTGVFRRLASRLRVDRLKLHRLLSRLEVTPVDTQAVRRSLGVLHALRLTLMQHMFLKAVRIPVFSRSNDISRDDVIAMVFSLRIEDAVAQLRRAYPVTTPSLADYALSEPSDYPSGTDQAYATIQSDYVDPIAQAYAQCLRISTAIANHFGAHG